MVFRRREQESIEGQTRRVRPSRVSIRRRWTAAIATAQGRLTIAAGRRIYLFGQMILDANKHRSSRQGQDCLHCWPFARVWDVFFSERISSFRLHRPNHMGGICSRNSCKSVDGSPPQRQSNGGVVDPACRGPCPCLVATQPAVVIAARCPLAPPSSCNHQTPGDPSSSEQSGACEMPGTPNLRQRSHQLATQQLPFMPGLLLRRGGRCPSMPRIMMACIEDRGRLPLPPGMAVVCRALAGEGGSCAVVATHLLMLASRRAVPEFPSLLPPFDAAPHHARTRTASWKGPGPRLPPSTALGGAALWVV